MLIMTCDIPIMTCDIPIMTCDIPIMTCNIPIMTCDIPIMTCDIFLNRLDLHRNNVRVGGIGTRDAQNNRQQNEAVEETEDDYEQKYFEESVEHVRLGVGEQDEGQKSGDASVEDCRANVPQSLLDSLLP
jgi:hypothetical protein